jgi:hypothetical protein
MSQESEANTQGCLAPEKAAAEEEPSNAQEMFLGKLTITDGKTRSYCQWTVVGAGDRWTYSAIMPLSSGSNHRIVMGQGPDGGFLREAYSDSKEDALAVVQARIMTFLKKQPRWRIID